MDSDGNLYCADSQDLCIQVFNKDGEFVRSFGSDQNGVRILKKPWYICIQGTHAYVGNRETCVVSVFTTDGIYLSSFGKEGDSIGDFNYPFSICIDQDGFLYVTDCRDYRVQCF